MQVTVRTAKFAEIVGTAGLQVGSQVTLQAGIAGRRQEYKQERGGLYFSVPGWSLINVGGFRLWVGFLRF